MGTQETNRRAFPRDSHSMTSLFPTGRVRPEVSFHPVDSLRSSRSAERVAGGSVHVFWHGTLWLADA